MLIQTKYKNGDIVGIKLISGEEIIAKLIDTTITEVVVSKPTGLTLVQNGPSGQGGVVFMPFSLALSEDENVTLNKSSIIAMGKARKEAANGYVKTTTGIEIPSGIIS